MKYCVAYLSLHEGELKMIKTTADSRAQALKKVLALEGWSFDDVTDSEDEYKDTAFNGDCYIEVIEI